MAVANLQGKRTGRPRGSRSSSPAIRDLRWASRNYGKDVEPPTAGAQLWAEMARNEPEKFVRALAALDAAYARTHDEQQNGKAVARAGQRLMTIFLPEADVINVLRRNRANMPGDGEIVGCALTKARGGVIFTIKSATFPPLAEGEPIPELRPKFRS